MEECKAEQREEKKAEQTAGKKPEQKVERKAESKKISLPNNRVKTPTVYQMEATECGAASLGMVLDYYGCYIPLEQLRVDCGVSRDGCNAKNIKYAAKKYGLDTKAYSKKLDQLLEVKPPAIIHWNFNHFVVYEGCRFGKVYLNDPGVGRRKLTIEELSGGFTGICMTFEPGESFQKNEKDSDAASLVLQRFSNYKKEMAGLITAGLILVVPGIVIPVFSQVFVDDILVGGNTDWAGALLLAMVGTLLFQAFFTWLKLEVIRKLQIKLKQTSTYAFLSHMFKLPVIFFEQRYAGDLTERVENNDAVNSFICGDLADTILNLVVAFLYFILLLFYHVKLTLIGLAGVVLNLLVCIVLSNSLENMSSKSQQDQGKLTGVVYSGLSIYDTLKASGAENVYITRILGNYAKYTETEQKIGRIGVFMNAAPSAVTEVFDIIVLMIGGLLVIQGEITAGVLVGFSQLLGAFTSPVNDLVGFFRDFQTQKANIARVDDIERYEVAPQFSDDVQLVEEERMLTGRVEMKHVSFGYSSLNPPLIEDFSFTLDRGKTIALVGASGSGKSTIGKLVSGLNDAWSGEVLFDGIPIRSVPRGIFTSCVSTVSQEISLFTGTIQENLTLWNPLANDKDVVTAARDACIHDTIAGLDGGYQHDMEEGGSNFSGGQRQRLEIARALACNPRVLVLDEATSALDAVVEAEVMKNIRRRGCSCVIIAHRLSTIRDADEIIVMDHGKIVQRGTHEEMKDVDGPYRDLIKAE